MRFRRSRPAPVSAAAPDRWGPLAQLCRELGSAVALQEGAERVILGCAGPWPVDGAYSSEGAPLVTELLRIGSRIADISVAELDSERQEDACYLVMYHQAALDRALRLAYTADADDASERERAALSGLGAPGEQLRRLHDETLALLRAEKPVAPASTATAAHSPGPSPARVSAARPA